ncbi:MAG: outer membrane beta-barrel protein [Novosphingobium sp.]|nr:outer membrane beta-barrel protein [Novosphingobium sp.]
MMAVLLAANVIVPTKARAQTYGPLLDSEIPLSTQTGRNRGVDDRARPELRQQGLPLGGFRAFPQIGGGIGFTSNVVGSEQGARSDGYAAATARLDLRSQWSRHDLSVTGAYDGQRYFQTSAKNENGYLAAINGNLDVFDRSSLAASASLRRRYEDQTAASFPASGGGSVAIDQTSLMLRGTHALNQLRITGSGDYNDFRYGRSVTLSGQRLDLGFRDHWVARMSGRLEYALSPDNAVFVQGTYRHTDYDMKTTTANRTSDEWRAGVGAIADVSSLIRIAGAVGYFRRTYDNPAFDSIGDLDVDFRLDYYVSPLTTVSTVFTRQLEEAIVAGSSGYMATHVGARVDHELLRNLIPYAYVDWVKESFRGADRDDRRWVAGLGAGYQPNRRWSVDFSASYVSRDSSGLQRGPRIKELRSLLTLKYNP